MPPDLYLITIDISEETIIREDRSLGLFRIVGSQGDAKERWKVKF